MPLSPHSFRIEPGLVVRALGVEFIDAMFERHFLGARPDRSVVQTRTIQAQQGRLSRDRQGIRPQVEEHAPLSAREGRGQIF